MQTRNTAVLILTPLAWWAGMLGCGAAAAQSAGVLASQDANAAGVVAEFTEARRKDGVLSIRIRLRTIFRDGDQERFCDETSWFSPTLNY